MPRPALPAAVLALLAAAAAADAPKVDAVGVREVRGADRSVEEVSSQQPGLTVVLQVSGLQQPARYGTVVVSEAKDDAGTDLKPAQKPVGDEQPVEFPAVVRHTGN